MADGGDNIFVYIGGEQEVPEDVTHVRIDRSVQIIPSWAFYNCGRLVSVEMHDDVEIIEHSAFRCTSLRAIKLPGVVEVGNFAFYCCEQLTDVEVGDKLETIKAGAFRQCTSLQKIKIPTVRTIGERVFGDCQQLTDAELPSIQKIGVRAFYDCPRLRRIVIPLKDNMLPFDTLYYQYAQFGECENLTTVDLVGGIHKTISSLLLESWRDEIHQEIDRINQVLPNTSVYTKTNAIRLWIRSVIDRVEHYKADIKLQQNCQRMWPSVSNRLMSLRANPTNEVSMGTSAETAE